MSYSVWVEMEAESSELWSDYDDDGNDCPRYRVLDKCGPYDRLSYLMRAIDEGKIVLAWPENVNVNLD